MTSIKQQLKALARTTAERRRKMQALRESGMTLEQIAKRYRITRQRVAQILDRSR